MDLFLKDFQAHRVQFAPSGSIRSALKSLTSPQLCRSSWQSLLDLDWEEDHKREDKAPKSKSEIHALPPLWNRLH